MTAIDPAAIAILDATPSALRSLVAGVPEARLAEPLDDGWSVRDAVAHLLDVEDVICRERIARILDEDRPCIRSIDPSARLRDRGFLARPLASLFDDLARVRPPDVRRVRDLSDAQLQRPGDHDEAGQITVADLVHQWAYHDLMHLRQIAAMLQSPLVPRMGNTRRFYDL